ncbi:MAG TPA: helix-turn-helix domain-containing protein [Terriglobales bacterium]|nr:helix-turn-helix domain-containing protein [Stellaceae bacterium]HZT73890.1 helix-turn-helix domain-containing protein [Terriglobales bacterium]
MGNTNDSPEVMNIRQAAEYLGISSDTLYKYLAEERIPAFKLGNRWKFKKTVLDRWMERQSFPVASAAAPRRPEKAKENR